MSPISLTPASAQDAEAIARLQAQSWRSTYRGMLPDEYLDHHVVADRLAVLAHTIRQIRVGPHARVEGASATGRCWDSYACCSMKSPSGARGWTTCTSARSRGALASGMHYSRPHANGLRACRQARRCTLVRRGQPGRPPLLRPARRQGRRNRGPLVRRTTERAGGALLVGAADAMTTYDLRGSMRTSSAIELLGNTMTSSPSLTPAVTARKRASASATCTSVSFARPSTTL